MTKTKLKRALLFFAYFLVAVFVFTVTLLGIEILRATRGSDVPDAPVFADTSKPDQPTITWLGDSTFAGVGATRWETTVAARVDHEIPHKVDLRAESGAKVKDVLENQLDDLKADIVIISVGANDTTRLTRMSDFESNYETLLKSLPENAKVICLGVPDIGSATRLDQPLRAIVGEIGEHFSTRIRSACEKHDGTFLDIATATGPKFRSDPNKYLASDKYHPSDAGQKLWAEAITPMLEKELRTIDN